MEHPNGRSQGLGDSTTFSDSVSADPAYPFMTIAIPTFNRATLLKGCVASALAQIYPHFEVVMSNNASSDNTRNVLSEFSDARSDPERRRRLVQS
jgi:glycosyltransferase involved in cell wall biosynthesis